MEECVLVFQAPNHSVSSCLIRMDRKLQIVIATWPENSRNATNVVDVLATELVNQYKLHPQRLLLIEYFGEDKTPSRGADIYYLVTFTWEVNQAQKPVRHPLSLAEFTQILLTLSKSN
ncbi:hypothetical protein EXU85_10695 [Spirosoma sp. KCTC 42546]|uniref:hypothetical protein n=1 Tax=Spirosoma sp. KCTC 42546 TaxID=2520506 RepID=UPI00115B48FB|nr:hypothetical protein [Spirosoma sp. KCTC 42546]QDK79052.1 hypothetical protein EXU85_10695 [Spirosoma sp. KCTC 42546]